jgi:hypothetical protein
MLVSLHPGLGNEFDFHGIGYDHPAHIGPSLIVKVPGVDGGFDDECVGRKQILFRPSWPGFQLHTPGLEHHDLLSIDAADHHILLMQVNGQIPFKNG